MSAGDHPSARSLPERPDLEQYRTQAKDLVKAHGAGDTAAALRIADWLPRLQGRDAAAVLAAPFALADAQRVIAREHGHESWPRFVRAVQEILAEAGDLDAQIDRFRAAVRERDPAEIRRLVGRFAALAEQIDAPLLDFGKPAIVEARDDRATVDALLDLGANIDARTNWEPGSFGVLDGASPEVAEYLISRGATVDAHAASWLGMAEQLKSLLVDDADLVHRRGPDGKLPLHCAASPEIVDLLLARGADIESLDVDHAATAVQYLVERPAACRRLIERGAAFDVFVGAALGDVGLIDRALETAPESLRAHTPRVLGESSDQSGYTYPPPPENSAHIYAWSIGFGWSPAFTAFQQGHEAACRHLLNRLSPTERLAEACAQLDHEAVRRVLEDEAPTDLSLRRGLADMVMARALHQRSLMGTDTAVPTLALALDAGFDVDAGCWFDGTPLHWAAWMGHMPAVQLLLDRGASVTRESSELGSSALQWTLHGLKTPHADFGGYPEIVRALIAAGASVDRDWLPTASPEIDRLLEDALRAG